MSMPNEDETDAQHGASRADALGKDLRLDYRLERPMFGGAVRGASHRRKEQPAGFGGQPIALDATNARSDGGNPSTAFVSSVHSDVG